MKIIASALLISLLTLGPAAQPHAGDCEQALQNLKDLYGDLPGISMDYHRHVITRSLSMTGEKVIGDFAEGRLYFKPPHFMKLVQMRPVEEHLITEGRNVWWYVPEKARVERYPASFFGKQLSLLSEVFQGFPEGSRSFACRIEIVGGSTVVVLNPDPPWKDIDHVAVTLGSEDSISTIDIRNNLGNVTRFTLGPFTVEESFARDFFTYSPPEGIRMEDMGHH